jgi:hypothetical protein
MTGDSHMSKRESQPKKTESQKKEDHRQHHEESLDKTIEDSFPASDPPSSIPDPDEDAA